MESLRKTGCQGIHRKKVILNGWHLRDSEDDFSNSQKSQKPSFSRRWKGKNGALLKFENRVLKQGVSWRRKSMKTSMKKLELKNKEFKKFLFCDFMKSHEIK